jgi:hypothetical protein
MVTLIMRAKYPPLVKMAQLAHISLYFIAGMPPAHLDTA